MRRRAKGREPWRAPSAHDGANGNVQRLVIEPRVQARQLAVDPFPERADDAGQRHAVRPHVRHARHCTHTRNEATTTTWRKPPPTAILPLPPASPPAVLAFPGRRRRRRRRRPAAQHRFARVRRGEPPRRQLERGAAQRLRPPREARQLVHQRHAQRRPCHRCARAQRPGGLLPSVLKGVLGVAATALVAARTPVVRLPVAVPRHVIPVVGVLHLVHHALHALLRGRQAAPPSRRLRAGPGFEPHWRGIVALTDRPFPLAWGRRCPPPA